MREHGKTFGAALGAGGGFAAALVLWFVLKKECGVDALGTPTECVPIGGIDYSLAGFAAFASTGAAGLGLFIQMVFD